MDVFAQLTKRKQIKAVEKAFAAYGKAVQAAQELFADGPQNVTGTCIYLSRADKYFCSECNGMFVGDNRWHFCAFCGAEIIRFAGWEEIKADPVEVKKLADAIVAETKKTETKSLPEDWWKRNG